MVRMSRIQPLSDQSLNILFVLGAARSGTSHLNLVLDRQFGFGMGPEGHFVNEFAGKLGRYGNLASAKNARRLAQDLSQCEMLRIIRDRWPEEIRFDVTPDQILERVPEPTYAGYVYAVFKCVALGQNKPHVGNKNPGFWQHLPLLHALFPTQAKYLAIVRDGRDVALSTMKTQWGEKSAYVCAQSWSRSLQAVRELERKLGGGRVLQIRYEDLLGQPRATMSEIQTFLSLDLEEDQIAQFVETTEQSRARYGLGKWREQMSDDDQRLFESVAAPWMRELGYETRYENPKTPWHEAARILSSEAARKVKVTMSAYVAR